MWDRRARLLSATDGDTIKIILDQGYGDTKQLNARLNGARAPEAGQEGHDETWEFTANWLEDARALAGRKKSVLSTLRVDQALALEPNWPLLAISKRIKSDAHEITTINRYVFDILNYAGESLTYAVNQFVAVQGYPLGF